MASHANKWPKQLPALSEEQVRIKDDFMKYWHEVLPARYGLIEHFNHSYPARTSRPQTRVLEIGAGLGEHLEYERLEDVAYYAVEFRADMADRIRERFPRVHVVHADCQQPIDLPDHSFDRILAIHVLEHLPHLPAALEQVHRLLKPDGEFVVVIPCEGGLAYSLARKVSAQRLFERRYHMSYDWFIQTEHINRPDEILEELGHWFTITDRQFFPLKVPSVSLNLVIGLRLRPLGGDSH